MKRIWMLFLALLFILPAGCSSQPSREKTSDGEDMWGLELEAWHTSKMGACFIVKNTTPMERADGVPCVGLPYLQIWQDGKWVDCPRTDGKTNGTDFENDGIASALDHSNIVERTLPWKLWYGENLKPGSYRAVMEVARCFPYGELPYGSQKTVLEEKEFYCYFEITDDSVTDLEVKNTAEIQMPEYQNEWGIEISVIETDGWYMDLQVTQSGGEDIQGNFYANRPVLLKWDEGKWNGYGMPQWLDEDVAFVKNGTTDMTAMMGYFAQNLEPGVYWLGFSVSLKDDGKINGSGRCGVCFQIPEGAWKEGDNLWWNADWWDANYWWEDYFL